MTSPTTDRRLGLVGNTALKSPVTVLADSNITQSGQQTIDGVAVLAINASGVPDRVLCTGMTDATKNGIFDVSAAAWTRSLDADGSYDFTQGTTVLVNSGTAYGGSYWRITSTGRLTIGSSLIAWARALASSISTLSFVQGVSGAVLRSALLKLRAIPADFEDFNAVGDGVADDTTALTNAVASGLRIVAQRSKTYKFSSTLTITDKQVDFSGCSLLYTGAKNAFAMVINSTSGVNSSCNVRDFVLKSTDTDTTNRTHGLCLGGSCGTIEDFRVEGFTGISVGMGSGAETYTGVTLPAAQQCFYWNVANFNLSATSGWGLVISSGNNANHIRNMSAFPFGSGTIPRASNFIDEVVVGGTGNTFERVSLEGSPSDRVVLLLPTANGTRFLGRVYIEFNTNWATPPYPIIEAQAGSSDNSLEARFAHNSVVPILDLGTANLLRVAPSFNVNGSQIDFPARGVSLIRNGRFENGASGWSDFSTAGSMTFGTGYLSGKSMRIDVVAGRPIIEQSMVTVGGYQLAALQGRNVTAAGFIRTNLTGVSMKVVGLTQNNVPPDEAWHWFTATVKIPSAAATAALNLITETSGLTGYVEWSDVSVVMGNEPQAVVPRDALTGSATYNPPSIAAGGQASTTVTCTGAVLGDFVSGVSFSLDTAGVALSGTVSAADTVTVLLKNGTAGAVDLASGTLSVRVTKA